VYETHLAGPTALKKVGAPKVRLELTTYRLTAGRAADCAIQELVLVTGIGNVEKGMYRLRGSNPRPID
jgi:hypothetical protein